MSTVSQLTRTDNWAVQIRVQCSSGQCCECHIFQDFWKLLITGRDKLIICDFFGDFQHPRIGLCCFPLEFSLLYLCSTCVLLVFYLCSHMFTCVHLCSLVFYLHSTCVHLCSTCVPLMFHLCSTCVLLVFICLHLSSFVFTCIHLCSFVFLLVWCFRLDPINQILRKVLVVSF